MSHPPSPDVPGLLRRYGLRPDKSLGQNFLVDTAALLHVADAANIQAGEDVLEVGAGLGSLTILLAARARHVVAIELDKDLIHPLQEILAPYPNVSLVQGDILALDPTRLMGQVQPSGGLPYHVVANIPYYITSALIRHLLEASSPPISLTLTVQREVAERICAAPGDMSLLALSVQVYGRPRIAARIPAGAFYPAPKIDSAVIQVEIYAQPAIPPALLPAFFRLAKAGFSQKRKTLRNALSGGMRWTPQQAEARLNAAGIDAQRRAETLSIEEWRALAVQGI
jgi:16S rRNA (adenine1518-N6/adenine1519-N6)-dimethyltransferase